MKVFAFDRDDTVDVNPGVRGRAVPLSWVRYLAHETDHVVWAIGNQRLVSEADIPGTEDLVERHPNAIDDPGHPVIHYRRERRLEILRELFPDAEAHLVIDDVDLAHLDGWTHYLPWDFVSAVEDGRLDLPIPDALR